MDLLDRYLHAVRFWLPKAQRQDIIAELSEDIRSEVEEKEAGLGRKLGDGELAAILKRRGSPFAVAQSYLPQRHLIGPALYPIYLFVLKLVALFYLVPWLAVWTVLVLFVPSYRAQHPGPELVETLGTLWRIALFVFAMVTIGFTVAERVRQKVARPDRWDPRRLPRVRDARRIPRSTSVADIVFGVIFLLFWLGALRFPEIIVQGTPPAPLSLGPVWRSFRLGYYWPVAALALVNVALGCANLIRRQWSRLRLGIRAAVNAVSAAIMALVLAAHWVEVKAQWAMVTASNVAPPGVVTAERWINLSVFATLLIAAVICAGECAWEIRRIVQMRKAQKPN
jgi:hypothetical protein